MTRIVRRTKRQRGVIEVPNRSGGVIVVGGGGGSGAPVPVVVGNSRAALGDGETDGALGLIRIGTWPNVHEALFAWNEAEEMWVGEQMVNVTQLDTLAMDLGNRSGAALLDWSLVNNPIPYNRAYTSLSATENVSSDATLSVVNAAGEAHGQPFPSSGTLYIRDNVISYTGKTGTTFTGCALVSGSGGSIPASVDVVALLASGWGMVCSPILFAAEMWAAGFQLQEKLTALMNGSPAEGVADKALTIAPYWYEFNDGDGLPLPGTGTPSGGLGLSASLTGTTEDNGAKADERAFTWAENDWGDWDSAGNSGKTITKRYLLPRIFGKMASGAIDTGEVLDTKLVTRWVG